MISDSNYDLGIFTAFLLGCITISLWCTLCDIKKNHTDVYDHFIQKDVLINYYSLAVGASCLFFTVLFSLIVHCIYGDGNKQWITSIIFVILILQYIYNYAAISWKQYKYDKSKN